jgi:hypothetical protein
MIHYVTPPVIFVDQRRDIFIFGEELFQLLKFSVA